VQRATATTTGIAVCVLRPGLPSCIRIRTLHHPMPRLSRHRHCRRQLPFCLVPHFIYLVKRHNGCYFRANRSRCIVNARTTLRKPLILSTWWKVATQTQTGKSLQVVCFGDDLLSGRTVKIILILTENRCQGGHREFLYTY